MKKLFKLISENLDYFIINPSSLYLHKGITSMKILSNKKGIEMSANIIVVLIIAIVIFVGGLGVTFKFFSLAEERRSQVDAETQASIENLLDTGAKVAIPIFKKEIKRGQLTTFGVGVRNLNAPNNIFHVIMNFDQAIDRAGNVITDAQTPSNGINYIDNQWISTHVVTEEIDNQQRKVIPIPVKVQGALCDGCSDPTTRKGTYIFNVCVCNEGTLSDGSRKCIDKDKSSPDNIVYKQCFLFHDTDYPNGLSRNELYGKTTGGDIHKILVEVT